MIGTAVRHPPTLDVDVNVFIAEADAQLLVGALPTGVRLAPDDIAVLARDGQVRLWWQDAPVDVFLNSAPLHEPAAGRARSEVFGRTRMPFLSCLDTAIFKAFGNADVVEQEGPVRLDGDDVVAAGGDDPRRGRGLLCRAFRLLRQCVTSDYGIALSTVAALSYG